MRRLAQAIGISPSALSLTLRGKRKLQLKEAQALSKALSLPLPAVLKHAGIDSSHTPAHNPFPGIPQDVKRILAREPKGSPLWAIIRAYDRK